MPFRFRRSFKLLRGTRLDLGDNGLRASLGRRRHPVTLTARGLRTRRAPPAPLPSVSLPVYPIIGMTCGLLALCLCLLASGGLVFGVTHLPVRATRTPAPPTATRVPTGTPTATRAPTLTPLPGQVYSMTQAARLKVTPYAPVFFKTETPTLISALTKTQAANLTLNATHTNAVCLLAYPDFCIPPKATRQTCDQLGRYDFTVLPPDPLHYDTDHNGIGCE